MAIPEYDSGVGHSFGLEFDGIQIKAITEVTGLKMEQDVIEYKSNEAKDGKYVIKKLPGRWKAGEIDRTHSPPRLMPQSHDKRFKPALQISLPPRLHGRTSLKPTTHESRNNLIGNPEKAVAFRNLPK